MQKMIHSIWFWVFVSSVGGLVFVAFRHRIGFGWLRALALNVAIAGLLLYGLNLAEPYTHLHLPMNVFTLGTLAALGVPGLAALVGLKLLVVV